MTLSLLINFSVLSIALGGYWSEKLNIIPIIFYYVLPMPLYLFFSTSCPAVFLAFFLPRYQKSPTLAPAVQRLATPWSSPLLYVSGFHLLTDILSGRDQSCQLGSYLSSLAEPSPLLGADGFLEERMSSEQGVHSVDLLCLLGSTDIPMVHATFLWMPGTYP